MDVKELLNNVWTFGFGEVTVGKVITTILLALICILVVRVLVKGMDRFIKKKGTNSAVAGFLRPLIKILLYFVALLVLADHVGIPVSPSNLCPKLSSVFPPSIPKSASCLCIYTFS